MNTVFVAWISSTINKNSNRISSVFIATGEYLVCVCVLVTRPLRGLAVKALRGMPPTLFNRSVLFTNRSITRCLEHAGDRQIFDFTMSGAPGSTYQGRRHAAEALNGEAAKRPSNYYYTHTHLAERVANSTHR